MRLNLLIPVAGLLSLLSGAVRADEELATDPSLSLYSVVDSAFERDPQRELPVAYHHQAEALHARSKSLLAGAPAVTFRYESDFANKSDLAGQTGGDQEWEAMVEMPVWKSGERHASTLLAERSHAFAEAAGLARRLEVSGMVREILWELALAEQQAAVAAKSLESAESLGRDVERRFEAGELSRSDLLLAKVEVVAKRDELRACEVQVSHLRKRYGVITGLDTKPGTFSEERSERSSIEENHPLLRLARLSAEQARAEAERVSAAGSERMQAIFLVGQEKATGTGGVSSKVGVGLRLPFASASYDAPLTTAALVTVAEREANLANLRRELELALHEAMHNLETIQQGLALAEEQNAIAVENLRMARRGFDVGETDLAALIRIQTRAAAAQMAVELQRLQLRQAAARYNQAVGDSL